MKKSTLSLSVVALTAVLSSCGLVDKLSPPTPAPTPAPNPAPSPALAPSIGNKIDSWDPRTATADLLLIKFSDGTRNSVASTGISTAGDFTLSLPSDADIAPYLADLKQSVATSNNCSGDFTYSDAAVQGRFFSTLYVNENADYTGYLATGNYGGDLATQSVTFDGQAYLYVDRDTSVTGTVTCTNTISGTPSTLNYNMIVNLKKGWNGAAVKAVFTQANNQGNYDYTLTDSSIDNTRKWFFVADTGSLQSSGVRAQGLNLPNLPEPLQKYLSQLLRYLFHN